MECLEEMKKNKTESPVKEKSLQCLAIRESDDQNSELYNHSKGVACNSENRSLVRLYLHIVILTQEDLDTFMIDVMLNDDHYYSKPSSN